MSTVIPRRERIPRPAGPVPELESMAIRWYINYQALKRIEKEQVGTKTEPGLRIKLLDEVRNLGRRDSAGHIWYAFKESLGGLYGFKAQRAVKPGWDEVAAYAILKEKGDSVLKECTATSYSLNYDEMPLIIETLRKAGVLEQCLSDVPCDYIDPELVLGYHQRHNDILLESEVDTMMPDEETWSLIPQTQPIGEISDVD